METTSLQNTIPSFFIAIDSVLLVIFLVEFVLKVSPIQCALFSLPYSLSGVCVLGGGGMGGAGSGMG